MIVEPTCKYGHGSMTEHKPPDNADGYYLGSFLRVMPESSEGYVITPTIFTFSLYRCSTCGYLEMFDKVE
jgi:hypothetical protein